MVTITSEIIINRPAVEVWHELTDFERHAQWNPFIKSIRGDLVEGGKLHIHIAPPGEKGMKFAPIVRKVELEKEFVWKGKLLIPGLFDGEHFFRLESLEENRTRFIHGEKFSGILVPLLKGMLEKTRAGFELMNQALKERVEKRA